MWILLTPDDTIQLGDEVFNETPWEFVDPSWVGQRVGGEIIRRRFTGWEELNDSINAFLDSKSERMTYQMCGFELTLNRNGTYSIDDTTGG